MNAFKHLVTFIGCVGLIACGVEPRPASTDASEEAVNGGAKNLGNGHSQIYQCDGQVDTYSFGYKAAISPLGKVLAQGVVYDTSVTPRAEYSGYALYQETEVSSNRYQTLWVEIRALDLSFPDATYTMSLQWTGSKTPQEASLTVTRTEAGSQVVKSWIVGQCTYQSYDGPVSPDFQKI